MINNYIDACALVRKDIFIELGGYDAKMKEIKSGWEDWEMWLRIAFAGKKFRYLPQIGFKYRVYEQSMISEIKNSYEIRNKLTDYIHRKYPFHMGQQYISAFVLERFKPYPMRFFIKLIMMAWFTKYYNKLLSKNKIIRAI
ncbi:MAG: glycosyltransferase family 2 protein [Ferruginibacter sp.]